MWNCKSFYQVVCFIQLSEAGVLSVSLKMDKIEYRAVIKCFVKEGLMPNEIHSKFIKVYGDSSPSFWTIKKWAAKFKHGRTNLEDDPREGHPKSATKPEIIEQVHDMVLDESAWNCWDYRHFKRMCRIYFAWKIGYKKALRKMGAALAHSRSKHTRMKISEQCLECFNKNKTDFVCRFITMDETWIHHYTCKSKQ